MIAETSRYIEEVVLEDCALLTERSLVPFLQMLKRGAVGKMTRFSLRGCKNLAYAGQGLVAEALADPDIFKSLKSFDLSNIQICITQQYQLCDSISRHPSAADVSLANTTLGSTSAS